jgi:membrane-anchored mycosin MYCP
VRIHRVARTLKAIAIAFWIIAAMCIASGPAAAVEPPPVPTDEVLPDGPPGPELPTRQSKVCLGAGLLKDSDLSKPPPPAVALNLDRAHALSQGAGVTVAVVDTGVSRHPRLPNLDPGGDYVAAGGDGLSDCDAHGTLVAGIIGAASDPADAFVGVAPAARIVSIRYRSAAFDLNSPQNFDEAAQRALEIRTLARAIVHAANLGAGVIVVPQPVCVKIDLVRDIDQSMLAAAIGYAVRVRSALVVAGAGDAVVGGCEQNPAAEPPQSHDPRNWEGVQTVSTPGWFVPDVLTVGYTTADGAAMPESLAGPWVGVAAPGIAIESVGPGGGVVNGVGDPLTPVGGSAYAAAYVSGVAALLRSRFPMESPAQIAARLQASAHNPARSVDNSVGAGLIDPVTALSYRTVPDVQPAPTPGRPLVIPPPPPEDRRPAVVAAAAIISVVALAVGVAFGGKLVRRSP